MLAEPTIDALYHELYPCSITVRTDTEFFPLFYYHPLIAKLVEKDYRDNEGYYDYSIVIPSFPEDYERTLPRVDAFASMANTFLRRKDPQLYLDNPERSTSVVDNTSNVLLIISSDEEDLSAYNSLRGLANVSIVMESDMLSDRETLEASLEALASANLVAGPDCWATQAAAALNTRVAMILSSVYEEKTRKPSNVTVARDAEDLVIKVRDIMYERRYPTFMNTGNAADWIKNKAKEYLKGNFLDVGCSQWPLPNSIPVDKHNREILEGAESESVSGIFSSHCLEHIEKWKEELQLWHKVIRKHGVLFMYLPHPQCEPWRAMVGSWVGSEHVWNPEPVTLAKALRETGFEVIEYSGRPDPLWSFYMIGRKI